MSPPHLYIHPPLPLITPRMRFYPEPEPDLPAITPRMQFLPSQFSDILPQTEETFVRSRSVVPMERMNQSLSQNGPFIRNTKSSIPKPPGEPGRPNSRGFTLDLELRKNGWSDADVEAFLERVREAAERYLDTKVSFRSQKPDLIQLVCDELSAVGNWPILQEYQNCWPVRCALKLALKYKAEASRRNEAKKATNRIRAALRPDVESEDED